MLHATLMTDSFEIDVRPDRWRVVLVLSGELDLATAGDLRRAFDELRDLGWREFVVDLRGLTFLDSTGIHLLLEADDHARGTGGSLALVHGRPEVRRVLELTGVADRLEQAQPRLR